MMPSASNINNKKPEKRASVSSTISGIGSGNPIVNNINNTVEIMKKSNNSISNGSNGTTNAPNNNNSNKASKEKNLNAAAGVISGTNNNCATATGSAPSIAGSVTGATNNNPTTSSNSGSSTNNPSSNNNNDPLKMALVAIEHKIRNLEKRKTKLESYRAIQANGKELSTDQRNAVAKYDSVMATLEFARDFAKQMTQFAKDAEKEQKKQARKDVIAKAHAETAKIREVIVIQNILSCFSEDVVRNDFLNGLNGAIKLEADEMESLEKFCVDIQARRPENSEEPEFVTQAQKAAELFSMTIDARPKAYGSTTFEKLRTTFGQIQECGYLDKIYMDEVAEIEVGGSGDASLERAKQEIDSLECLEKGLNSVKLSNETGHLGEVGKDVNLLQGGASALTPSGGVASGNVVPGMQQVEGTLFTQGPAGLVGAGPGLNVGQLSGANNPTVVVPGGLVGATITADGKQQQILINPVTGNALPQNGQAPTGIPIQATNLHYAPVTVDAVEQAFKHQHHHHHQQQQPQQQQHMQQQHLQQHHHQKQQMQQQYLQMRPLAEVIGSGSFFFLQDSELDSPETATGGVLPPAAAAAAAAAAVASGAVLPPPGVSQQPHQQPPLQSMVNVNQKVVGGEQKIQDPLDPSKILTMSSLDPLNPLRNDPQQQAALQQKATHPGTAQGINSQTFTNQSFPQTQQKPQIQQQQQQQQQQSTQQSQNQKLQQQVAQIGQATAAAVAAANASASLSGKKTPVSFNDPQQQPNSIFQKQQTGQHSHQQQQLFTSPVSFAQIQKQQQQQQQHQQQMNSSDPQSQQQPMMILSRLAAPQARHPSQNQQSNSQQSQQQQLHHHQQKSQSQGLSVAGGNSGSGGVLNHPIVSDTVSSNTPSAGSNKTPSSVTGFFDTLVYEQQIQLAAKLNAAAANVEKVAMENVGSNANERDSNMKQSKNSMGSVLPDALSENSNAFDPLKWTAASLTPNTSSNPSNTGNHMRKNDWASTAAGYNDSQTPGNESSNHWGPQNDNISPYVRSGNAGSGTSALRSSNNYPRRSDDQRGNSGGRPGTNNGNGNGGYRNRNNNYGGGNNNGPQTNGGRTMLYRNDPTSVGGNSSYYQNGGGGGGNGVYGKDNGPRYDASGSYRGPRGGGMNANNGNGGGPVGNGNGRGGNGPNRGLGGGRSGNNPNNSAAAYMRQTARIPLGLDTKN